MKYGKKIEIKQKFKINLTDYQDAHLKSDCKGKFRLGFAVGGYYEGTALGPIKVPCLLMVECSKCGAVHYIESFSSFIDKVIATNLVISKDLLLNKQIKFLRQYFGMTQDELGRIIRVDRFEISKMESSSTGRAMSPEKQVVMKMRFAKLLNIKDFDSLYGISEYGDSVATVKDEWFPTKEELKKKIA